MARKGAFSDDALDDIDDLLPKLDPPVIEQAPPAGDPPVDSPAAPVIAEATTADAPKERRRSAGTQQKRATTSKPTATSEDSSGTRRARPVISASRRKSRSPEAHVDPVVADALRNLTHAEKQRRGEGRSYGAVVLDAIENHQAELKKYFAANVAKPASGLFSRVEAGPQKRRRHTTPPVKIPLAGIIPSDIEALDALADEWQAGNRSALVDKALQLYLAPEINRLVGVPEHDSAGSEDRDAEGEAASA